MCMKSMKLFARESGSIRILPTIFNGFWVCACVFELI